MNRFFGIVAAVLVALACAISAGNALSRYVLDLSSNAFLEIQWQMFAGVFLLGAPYVLKLNEHVRVCFIMLEMAWPWALTSYLEGEISANAGGLPVWPAKFLLPFGFSLLALQGLAEFIRRIAALRGDIALDVHYEKPVQ